MRRMLPPTVVAKPAEFGHESSIAPDSRIGYPRSVKEPRLIIGAKFQAVTSCRKTEKCDPVQPAESAICVVAERFLMQSNLTLPTPTAAKSTSSYPVSANLRRSLQTFVQSPTSNAN